MALGGFKVLKKTSEAPYTTKKRNYRDHTSRGTTLMAKAQGDVAPEEDARRGEETGGGSAAETRYYRGIPDRTQVLVTSRSRCEASSRSPRCTRWSPRRRQVGTGTQG